MAQNIPGLLSFVEAARAGSMSAAARKLDLTPAAISKNVLRLEGELGVRLFNRSTRQLRLTPEGERFFARAEVALRELDEAVAEVGRALEAPSGRVRISVGVSFGRRWVAPALPALLQRYPALQIELDLDNRQVDLIAEGYDIGIRGGVIHDSALIARHVCDLPVVLVASPEYLARRGVPSSRSDLVWHDCIGVRFVSGTRPPWRFHDSDAIHEIVPESRLLVSEPEAAVELAVAGAGIAQISVHHVVSHLRAGRLQVLLLAEHESRGRAVVLHYPHRQFLAPRVRATVEYMLQHFAAQADLQVGVRDLEPFAPAPASSANVR